MRSGRRLQRHACTASVRPFQYPVGEDFKANRDKRFKDKAPDIPSPGPYQQTLKTSFTVGGLGLHSAEYAHVRIRPAYAGEGRYFVRVPKGTNSHLFKIEEPDTEVDLNNPPPPEVDGEAEDLKVQLFLEWLKLQEQGYKGTLAEFVGGDIAGTIDEVVEDWRMEQVPLEDIRQRSSDEVTVPASLESLVDADPIFTTLGEGDHRVEGVEHLLCALEMFGVDNARIEIEGGFEVPIIDGSALGWAINIQRVGVRKAVQSGEKESMKSRRVPVVREPVTVTRDDGAFISYVPGGDRQQLTAGVDHADVAPIIGRQFVSWASDGGAAEHFRWKIAPARNYGESLEALTELRRQGYIKGGTADCTIIAYGDRWYDQQKVRYYDDEPARHKIVDLTGDLALLAQPGGGGVPNGHIISYNSDHALNAKFVRALAAALDTE